jgi:hypothetical protein
MLQHHTVKAKMAPSILLMEVNEKAASLVLSQAEKVREDSEIFVVLTILNRYDIASNRLILCVLLSRSQSFLLFSLFAALVIREHQKHPNIICGFQGACHEESYPK